MGRDQQQPTENQNETTKKKQNKSTKKPQRKQETKEPPNPDNL